MRACVGVDDLHTSRLSPNSVDGYIRVMCEKCTEHNRCERTASLTAIVKDAAKEQPRTVATCLLACLCVHSQVDQHRPLTSVSFFGDNNNVVG